MPLFILSEALLAASHATVLCKFSALKNTTNMGRKTPKSTLLCARSLRSYKIGDYPFLRTKDMMLTPCKTFKLNDQLSYSTVLQVCAITSLALSQPSTSTMNVRSPLCQTLTHVRFSGLYFIITDNIRCSRLQLQEYKSKVKN